MSDNVIQTSFASGELSPSIFARVDLTKYRQGAARMRNFFVDYRSGASSRAGLQFINFAKISSKPVRLITFQFNAIVSFVIEFGDHYCRFFNNGSAILETPLAVTAISNASPAVAQIPGNTYAAGDSIFLNNLLGMPQLTGRYVMVTGVAGAAVTLGDSFGNPINSTAYGTYTGGGTSGRIYTIASPYAAEDLALLKFVQQQNIMTFTHTSYPPTTLTATTATNWVFNTIVFGPTVAAPTGIAVTFSTAGSTSYSYTVTAVSDQNEESPPGTPGAVSGAANIGATQGSMTIVWDVVPGAVSYNVYKAQVSFAGAVPAGQEYGFIGSATTNKFVDSNVSSDFSETPPIVKNPFAGGNNPGCCVFFQQRIYYAGSVTFPTTFWASIPAVYTNFNTSDPVIDSDAYNGTLVSLQVNAIKSMLPMPGGLILLTSQGAWQLSSGSGGTASTGAVTPTNATATPQAYNGASDIPPIVVNYDVLYVQSKGTMVRDLNYNIYAAIYTGSDISVLSNHLFFGRKLVEWAYAEEPFKIIWAIRDNGTMLSLTYVKEQEIYGWSRHDTFGLFKSVCALREGNADAAYMAVSRFLQGQWITCIERMGDRTFLYGAEDSFCLDCALKSSLPTPATGIRASSSSGPVTFTADANVFSSATVGSVLRMDGGIANITGFTSATVVTGTWTQPATMLIYNDPNHTPIPALSGEWTLAVPVKTFFGLDHLNGQTVNILADGGVVAPQVVANGMIHLPNAATKVVAGLPFVAQLQTMYLDIGQEVNTIQGKRKKINGLTVRCVETRGLKVGRTFNTLTEVKELQRTMVLGQPIPLLTGDTYMHMDSLWDVPGQICIQQDQPLPATILGVVPEITLGDTGTRG